jgi:hypothetical protein
MFPHTRTVVKELCRLSQRHMHKVHQSTSNLSPKSSLVQAEDPQSGSLWTCTFYALEGDERAIRFIMFPWTRLKACYTMLLSSPISFCSNFVNAHHTTGLRQLPGIGIAFMRGFCLTTHYRQKTKKDPLHQLSSYEVFMIFMCLNAFIHRPS